MASSTVHAAFRAKIATWVSIGDCPLVDLNEVEQSPRAAFLELDFPAATEERITIGRPAVYREEGGARFTIHAKLLGGVDQAVQWIDEIRNLFRDATFDDIYVWEVAPATFDHNRNSRGFYEVSCIALYKFDFIH